MGTFKELQAAMDKLQGQIKTVLRVSDYRNYDDLSGLSDYRSIKTADERQMFEEYRGILQKLDDVAASLEYFQKPIREVSRIYCNESGRYETDRGHYYTSGSSIEFLRQEEVYNYDTDEWETADIWTCSRVEHNQHDYYIVGYPGVELSGLTVRVRG